MNYFPIIKKLINDTYPGLILSISYGFAEDTKYKITTEKFIIIINEIDSVPVNRYCYVTTTITIDVLYGLRKDGNDILKAKRLRDQIARLLDGKTHIGVTPDVFDGLIVWRGNTRSGRDKDMNIGYHGAEFDLGYSTSCIQGCNIL